MVGWSAPALKPAGLRATLRPREKRQIPRARPGRSGEQFGRRGLAALAGAARGWHVDWAGTARALAELRAAPDLATADRRRGCRRRRGRRSRFPPGTTRRAGRKRAR